MPTQEVAARTVDGILRYVEEGFAVQAIVRFPIEPLFLDLWTDLYAQFRRYSNETCIEKLVEI